MSLNGSRHTVVDRPSLGSDTEALPELVRTERDGLPIVWAEQRGPFQAGLVFRVGRADERTTHNGITHLVEHLALPRQAPPGVEFNGFVSGSLTSFWVGGERDEALELLGAAVESVRDLPDRLETERGILLTEEEGRGHGAIGTAAAARWGPRGQGLIGHREYGLRWLQLPEISAWADARFTRDNAVLWMTGPPPADFRLELPTGARYGTALAPPIADVSFPVVYPYAGSGGAALALLMPRTSVASVAASIALERLRQRIRYSEGLSYMVDLCWDPLNADSAHVVFLCDCQRGRERTVALALYETLDELARDGASEEELARELEERQARYASTAGVPQMLFAHAADELLGRPHTTPAELLEEAAAVTPRATAAVVAESMQEALLLTPEKLQPSPAWSLYPEFSPTSVSGGRVFRAGSFGQRLRRRRSCIRVGDDGLTAVTPRGEFVTVRYDDCVAVERWPGDLRILLATDGVRLIVDPRQWKQGKRLVTMVDEQISGERLVPMNATVDERAVALAGQHKSNAADIEAMAAQLEYGEVPLAAVGLSTSEAGTLMLTERRLILTHGGLPRIDIPLHEITTVRPKHGSWPVRTALTIEAGADTYTFEPHRREALEFVAALTDALAQQHSAAVVEPSPHWKRRLPGLASLLALPLSLLSLVPVAVLGNPESHTRIDVLSLGLGTVTGSICAVGAWLGLIGRRRARTDAVGSRAPTVGLVLALLGAFLWIALATSTPVGDW